MAPSRAKRSRLNAAQSSAASREDSDSADETPVRRTRSSRPIRSATSSVESNSSARTRPFVSRTAIATQTEDRILNVTHTGTATADDRAVVRPLIGRNQRDEEMTMPFIQERNSSVGSAQHGSPPPHLTSSDEDEEDRPALDVAASPPRTRRAATQRALESMAAQRPQPLVRPTRAAAARSAIATARELAAPSPRTIGAGSISVIVPRSDSTANGDNSLVESLINDIANEFPHELLEDFHAQRDETGSRRPSSTLFRVDRDRVTGRLTFVRRPNHEAEAFAAAADSAQVENSGSREGDPDPTLEGVPPPPTLTTVSVDLQIGLHNMMQRHNDALNAVQSVSDSMINLVQGLERRRREQQNSTPIENITGITLSSLTTQEVHRVVVAVLQGSDVDRLSERRMAANPGSDEDESVEDSIPVLTSNLLLSNIRDRIISELSFIRQEHETERNAPLPAARADTGGEEIGLSRGPVTRARAGGIQHNGELANVWSVSSSAEVIERRRIQEFVSHLETVDDSRVYPYLRGLNWFQSGNMDERLRGVITAFELMLNNYNGNEPCAENDAALVEVLRRVVRNVNDVLRNRSELQNEGNQPGAQPSRRRVITFHMRPVHGLVRTVFTDLLQTDGREDEAERLLREQEDAEDAKESVFKSSEWGDCRICMAESPCNPMGCIFCRQLVGCTKCCNRWYRAGRRPTPSAIENLFASIRADRERLERIDERRRAAITAEAASPHSAASADRSAADAEAAEPVVAAVDGGDVQPEERRTPVLRHLTDSWESNCPLCRKAWKHKPQVVPMQRCRPLGEDLAKEDTARSVDGGKH